MFNNNTDREWERIGKHTPYYGVLVDERFHISNLTDEIKEEFFQSGIDYINHVIRNVRQHIDQDFSIRSALDFGCGAGRLVIPLAGVAQNVIGVDVSDSMLKEARKNCEERSIGNVELIKSDDSLSGLNGKFDFIHSIIVFQHIPVKRGERIFANLIKHLDDNGVCVVHFMYSRYKKTKRFISFIKKFVPFSVNLINWTRGKGFMTPHMQMNAYNLNRLFMMMQKAKVTEYFAEFSDHGGYLGVILYFKKPTQS